MNLFGGVIPITGVTFLLFCLFGILFVGYALGRITIKGVSLGDSGVFIVALIFGALLYGPLKDQLILKSTVTSLAESFKFLAPLAETAGDEKVVMSFIKEALKVVESLGLILFVTSVGFIAGPKFFANMKKNFKSYVLIGLVIIIAGGLAAVACVLIGYGIHIKDFNINGIGFGTGAKDIREFVAMIVGLLSGSLTSTPAFSAAKATVENLAGGDAELASNLEAIVAVGHGISYIFGVVGVVLFVQLVPKIMKADMAKERALIAVAPSKKEEAKKAVKLLHLDHMGIAAFSVAAILGIFVGSITIPLSLIGLKGTFALTTTGGCLLVALILGHFGRIGKISLMPAETTLKLFRELGLVLFLAGAGIAGGAKFVECFDPMYFVYGIIMTVVPMIIGFIFAKYVLRLSLLNNLGSLTGGMTSTPALGTLIGTAGTEDVAAAYAATYPIALIAVVLVSQFLLIMFW
ncbi:MAG: permease [Clostridia bacterium]|nr:permease [Clostridia bacterium]